MLVITKNLPTIFLFYYFFITFVGMKRLWIPIIVSALTICAGCGNNTSIPTISFEKAKLEKEVPLTNDPDAPSCSVVLEVDYATSDNTETARAINDAIEEKLFTITGLSMEQALDSFTNQYTREYKQNLAPLYAEDKGDDLKRTWYEYNYSIDTETQTGRDDRIVIYMITMDYYEGGAHGIEQLLVMNFDKLSGRQLTLKDIFVPGYEARLTELLLEKLMDITDTNNMEELKAKGFLFSMDMFPSENFKLADGHIVFVYNAYEIAPYAIGRTELDLTYDEVSEILKK